MGHEPPRRIGGTLKAAVPLKPAADRHQKLISRISAMVQTNSDNRMALKFCQVSVP